ncbi:tRNA (guanine-N1-)-methyltransferase [Candidatus Kinetoplastibacterium blastocrithidii TCC012E]|uniref:tRNA (guanine-N(1)-)-methyltransferase n=1 Tax=Candidatus Kinetoplastidibacterium blastocrithidiae TCC012E TaxID=1208922 RepID=M1MDM7_9PROT|nr:tRNA (guanosine(37)-N1)-methyltransferase TrmD [Candidatus Kinetoplastibacterium blastocrithidii]AFZ83703.1 methyltransferase [Candidatus Kinetoplastibacterium blastocrithidii (ex Strigomonas culicis)]AGF49825.1 tRNA (guanine-N1-)-methyltransferase [Candidatus Kinetoplastibacterium blastocrithidii TCC012E]
MRLDIITLFPEIFNFIKNIGVVGRAYKNKKWELNTWNPRDFTNNKTRRVDDNPYGGGPGMVMSAESLENTVSFIKHEHMLSGFNDIPVILLSPIGDVFDQDRAIRLSKTSGAILVCGRYEGVDKRFVNRCVTHEISIGDFILSGGEIAALALIDAVVRLLPNVLGNDRSKACESFSIYKSGLLDDHPYTKPRNFKEEIVPEVLLNGNHSDIRKWNREKSLMITFMRRPDLIIKARNNGFLTEDDELFISLLKNNSNDTT